MERHRDSGELAAALEAQKRAIVSSSRAFDEGEDWEACRIATAVHVIVHDSGKRTQSLLSQMGVRKTTEFVASGRPVDPTNLVACTPLVKLRIQSAGNRYLPILDESRDDVRLLNFRSWWEQDFIFRSADSNRKLTRKKLVFALRSQDGGAHYDAVLRDPNYIEAKHRPLWFSLSGAPVQNLERAIMRQVGWELLQSLERAGL